MFKHSSRTVPLIAPLCHFARDSLSISIDHVASDLLKEQPLTAAVAADSANVCHGPGTEYDKLGALYNGTSLQVLAQANGWYQARLDNSRIVWIAVELPTRRSEQRTLCLRQALFRRRHPLGSAWSPRQD